MPWRQSLQNFNHSAACFGDVSSFGSLHCWLQACVHHCNWGYSANTEEFVQLLLPNSSHNPSWCLGDKVCKISTIAPLASVMFLLLVHSIADCRPVSIIVTGVTPQILRNSFNSCFRKLSTKCVSVSAARLCRSLKECHPVVLLSTSGEGGTPWIEVINHIDRGTLHFLGFYLHVFFFCLKLKVTPCWSINSSFSILWFTGIKT